MNAIPEAAAIVEDLTDTSWRDDQWLQFYPLNSFTALDYFSMSPFFVRGSNNELARMQGLDLSKMG
jgi:mediator of RNA polymerase II transcription subunit 6